MSASNTAPNRGLGLAAAAERLILRISAASQTGQSDLYRQTAETYRRVYPNDRAIDLLSIALLTNEKKVDEALAAIDRVEVMVGGDTFLNNYRGAAYLEAGRTGEAEQMFLRAAEDPAALINCYWPLIALALRNQQHDKTLKYLLVIEQRYGMGYDDLATVREYGDFLKRRSIRSG